MKRFTYYLPRVLAGLIAAFLYLFVLEGLHPEFGIGDAFWHFVLATAVLLVTILAWKKPKVGGFLFVVLGILYLFMATPRGMRAAILILGEIPIMIGVLFLIEGFGKKRE